MKYDLMSHEISKQKKTPSTQIVTYTDNVFHPENLLEASNESTTESCGYLDMSFFSPGCPDFSFKTFHIYIFPPKKNSFGQTHRKDFAFGFMGTPAVMTVLTPPVAETQTSASSSRRFGIVWRLQISARYMPFSISGGNGDRGGRGGGGIPGMKAGRVPGYQGSLAAAVAAATSTVSTTTLVRARPSELAQTKLNRFVFLAAGGASMALAFV